MNIEFVKLTSETSRWRVEQLADLLSAWFWFNDIYVGTGKDNITVEYNNLYHFYSIVIFEHHTNRGDAKTAHFNRAVDLLKRHGHHVQDRGGAWRWDPESGIAGSRKMIRGIKIWVKAVEPRFVHFDEYWLDKKTGELFTKDYGS